jgi:hypothetical protein
MIKQQIYIVYMLFCKPNYDMGGKCGQWFSLGTPVSFSNRTERLDITEILLKVALNTTNQTNQ